MTDTRDVLGLTVRDFIAATADKQPTPGGGSVAGVAGALAVALAEMSLNYTRGKKKFAQHEAFHEHLAGRLARAREMFQQFMVEDIQAYELYQQAVKTSPDSHGDDVQLALSAAINIPREMTKLALALMEDALSLADKCNPWLVSDLVASAALAQATIRMSDYNVRINSPQLNDHQAALDIRIASRTDVARARDLLDQVEKAAQESLG